MSWTEVTSRASVKVLKLSAQDTSVIVSAYFTGGPVRITTRPGSGQVAMVEFAADPFFRRADAYLAAGAVVLNKQEYTGTTCEVAICFPNQVGTGPARVGRLEVISPHRELNQESVVLFSAEASVAPNDCDVVVIHLIGAST